ncbi:MAG TPA: trypsin-like peptidase domain-containing protein [Chloroflexota bacterium]
MPVVFLSLALTACSLPGSATSGPTATPATSPTNTAGGDQLLERAAAAVSPSVVRIDNPGKGLGSGVIMSRDGDIVTNDHVVTGGSRFEITFANGRTATASLLGGDPPDDLAVVRANAKDLPAATFGNSSTLKVGQSVLAIGNPLGINFSVTEGIVSALNRTVAQGQGHPPILNMVQTSAAINPGNSGGALIDLTGKVIGIPTLSAVDPTFGTPANGVGFAIASNTVERIAPQLVKYGKVVNSGRAAIGIDSETVTPELAAQYSLPTDHGVLVVQLVQNGPAARAGIPAGSVIVQIDARTLTNSSDLADFLAGKKPGDTAAVTVVRSGGGRQTYHVTLSELPVGTS